MGTRDLQTMRETLNTALIALAAGARGGPRNLAQTIVSQAATILAVGAAYLFLPPTIGGQRVMLAAVPGWVWDPRKKEENPPRGNLQPELLPPEAAVQEVFSSGRPTTVKVEAGTALLVPLTPGGGNPIGVLAASSRIPEVLEERGPLEVMTTLALFAALSLQNILDRAFQAHVPPDLRERALTLYPESVTGGERTLATTAFFDIAGSTSYIDREPAKKVSRTLSLTLNHIAECVLKGGGTYISFAGDSVLALFEGQDRSEKAIASALQTQQTLPQLWEREGVPAGHCLKIRVAIVSGPVTKVLLGAGGGEQGASGTRSATVRWEVMGKGPSLAARVQALAEPGQVVVNQAACEEAGGAFRFAPLGSHCFKGFERAEHIHAVTGNN